MQVQPKTPRTFGLYVHVPFCTHTCDFCAFYQVPPTHERIKSYLQGIEKELKDFQREWQCHPHSFSPLDALDASVPPVPLVFIGGGTLDILSTSHLERLCASILQHLPVAPAEWTVELAPHTVKPDKLRVLKDYGVNRISMGVQHFDQQTLQNIGRYQHHIERAICQIRESGIPKLNLDLIFALPGQTLENWEQQLAKAISIAPEHLSTYCLTIEQDTVLHTRVQAGTLPANTPEEEEAFYHATYRTIDNSPYHTYEIAHHALAPHHACAYNLNTWNMGSWRGIGPSAVSQWRQWRFRNVPNLTQWLKHLSCTPRTHPPVGTDQHQHLTPQLLMADTLIFGLRQTCGVHLPSLTERYRLPLSSSLQAFFQRLTQHDLATYQAGTLALTPKGRLLADAIGADIIDTPNWH